MGVGLVRVRFVGVCSLRVVFLRVDLEQVSWEKV